MVASGALTRRVRHLRHCVPVLASGTWVSVGSDVDLYRRLHQRIYWLLDRADRLTPEALAWIDSTPATRKSLKPFPKKTPARWLDAVVALEEAEELFQQNEALVYSARDLQELNRLRDSETKESARRATLAKAGTAANQARANKRAAIYVKEARAVREHSRRRGRELSLSAIAHHLEDDPPPRGRQVGLLSYRQIYRILLKSGL
jgi:hypothetical protein